MTTPVRDAPREWLTFTDPDDVEHELRVDITWLLSRWTCVFGTACQGVVAGRAADGCCSHGAFFADKDDQRRVRAFAKELTAEEWQLRKVGRKGGVVEVDEDDGRKRTRTVDGACVFLNRADFAAGTGCALHLHALNTGLHPLETKPDVCWQLPVARASEWVDRLDETQVRVTTIGEFDRRGWGPGGADLNWWCTDSADAHVGATLLYESYGPELIALVGEAAYAVIKEHCDARREPGQHVMHPATREANERALLPVVSVTSGRRRS